MTNRQMIVLLAILFVGILWYGFVLMILWNIFAVSALDAPRLNLVQASGLVTIFHLLTANDISYSGEELLRMIISLVFMPLVFLGIGLVLWFFL